jgi:hypothetical protein
MIAKGKSSPDGTYLYKCAKCAGRGMVHGSTCDHCYNLNTAQIAEHLKLARGQRYYALLKALLSVNGKAIVDEAKALIQRGDKFTIIEVAYLALKFGMSFKAMFEWLEETLICPTGMHEAMRDTMRRNKVTVADIFDKAREKYPEMQE